MVTRTRSSLLLYAIIGGTAAAAATVIYTFDPATAGFYPPCVFHQLTGLLCPGCGGTRALHQLLHGNVAAAFALNPMLFGFIGAAPVIAFRPSILTRSWFGLAAVVVLLGWGVLRNVAG